MACRACGSASAPPVGGSGGFVPGPSVATLTGAVPSGPTATATDQTVRICLPCLLLWLLLFLVLDERE